MHVTLKFLLMKKLFIAALVLINLSFADARVNHVIPIKYNPHHGYAHKILKDQNTVYICNGPKSYAYHTRSTCSGLNNCSTQIYAITLSDALKRGRRACQKCY